ncbi:unnamed protein product [Lasius platythorax]|uniref:Uncharacterized protein n=1 Tax=Lasius platythorax TaxID=488582 RepID=A0AAV2N3X6_9HYME
MLIIRKDYRNIKYTKISEHEGEISDTFTISLAAPESNLVAGSPASTTSLSLALVVDLRRRRRGPSGIKPLVPSLGGDSVFHVEAERRRASGCRTDEGVSNPRDAWWGAVANAVPDGSPRRCNAFRRLRSIVKRVLRHVTAPSKTRIESKTLRISSTIREIQVEVFRD